MMRFSPPLEAPFPAEELIVSGVVVSSSPDTSYSSTAFLRILLSSTAAMAQASEARHDVRWNQA